ncbi:MAG: hypothetical protein II670_06460 [Alphaproteobacteria bacterium]|jgi:hypothetical protein|nr:hypothetical protein [Alphaproteobacteria bacterium]
MKILLDPNIAVLIKDMSDAECAEILRCIFEYPNRDCEIGLWKYIKTQIDRDAQKYKEKCDRALALVEKRKETDTKSSTKSSSISCMKSSVIVSSKEKDIDKNIDIEKEKDSSIAARNVENSVKLVENHVENFLINEYFSLQSIAQVFPDFAICIKPLLPAIVTRAERTLKQKRQGQRLTMKQILEWVEQERVFYQQSHNKDKA